MRRIILGINAAQLAWHYTVTTAIPNDEPFPCYSTDDVKSYFKEIAAKHVGEINELMKGKHMTDIVRCKNIVEAIKYLEPNHILTECLDKDGFAINYQRNDAVKMPDGRVAFLCNTGNFNFYRCENKQYYHVNLVYIDYRAEKYE